MLERGGEVDPLAFDALAAGHLIDPLDPVVQDGQPMAEMAGSSNAAVAGPSSGEAAGRRVIEPLPDVSISSDTDSVSDYDVSLDGQSYDLPGKYMPLSKKPTALQSVIRSRFAIMKLLNKK